MSSQSPVLAGHHNTPKSHQNPKHDRLARTAVFTVRHFISSDFTSPWHPQVNERSREIE